jgi:hypothetical protein
MDARVGNGDLTEVRNFGAWDEGLRKGAGSEVINTVARHSPEDGLPCWRSAERNLVNHLSKGCSHYSDSKTCFEEWQAAEPGDPPWYEAWKTRINLTD